MIDKMQSLAVIAEGKMETESLPNYGATIKLIHQQNHVCHQLRLDLGQIAQLRQACYAGGPTSLKSVVNELWHTCSAPIRSERLPTS